MGSARVYLKGMVLHEYVSTAEAAALLGVSRCRVWQLVRAGKLQGSVKIGSQFVHNLLKLQELQKRRELRVGEATARVLEAGEQLNNTARRGQE